MLDKIKGAIFDMDGTLINSLIIWDILWSKFGEKYIKDGTFRPSAESDKRVRTMTLLAAMELIHSEYGLGESGEELLDEANRIMVEFYENDVELKEGVADFLDECQRRGIRMCIASATDKKLLSVALRHCGLEKYFEKVFSCADVGKGKDEPDVFLEAMRYLGTDKESTCVFEDSAVAIVTSHRMGLMTVGIFDENNYGQDLIKATADVYIDRDETLLKLIN